MLKCQLVDGKFQTRVNLKLVKLVMLIWHDFKESLVKAYKMQILKVYKFD